jgi:raffinose/stachyose/melibiose transport system permease protein
MSRTGGGAIGMGNIQKSKSSSRQSKGTYLAFALPSVILYTFFLIMPIFLGFYYSLTDWNGVSQDYNVLGFENYVRIFKDARMLNSISFTLRYTLMLVIFTLVLSLICAMALNTKIKGQTFFRSVFFFPAVLSSIVIGLMWNEILYRVGPVIGNALNIEVLKVNILSNDKTAQFGILLVNLWQGLSIPIVLFIAGLQVIPEELYEAATIDGANAISKFRSITLPFIMPIINVVLILTIKSGLMIFDLIRGMTDGGPGRSTESLSLLIYRNAFAENNYSFGVAQSVVLFAFIAAISFVQFSILGKKEVGEI